MLSNSLWPQGLYSSWNSPGQNTGVGSLSLLQGIFPTQGSNPGHLHCRRILYQMSHKGSPLCTPHTHTHTHTHTYRLPRWRSGKEFTKAREMGSIPGWGRSPGEEMATHSSILAWWATVHGLTKSQTWLSNWAHIHTYTHTYTHTHIHTYFKILIYIICSSVLTFTFCVKYIFHNMKSNICHI